MANRNYIVRNTTEGLPVLLKEVMTLGHEIGSRNGRVKELDHIGITMSHPAERVLMIPGRKNNLAAQIAETMWVLAGRNDVGWLAHYLPRAPDYSDDGTTWRGGYGPRIRSWYGEVDQLAYAIDTLKEHSLSRQAVIGIYNPKVDTQPGKDIPCNDFIIFSNRFGVLDMNVTIRSNDAIWGWSGINVFEWSMVQEVVAVCLGIEVGSLHFNIASFHVYEPHWNKANEIALVTDATNAGRTIDFEPTLVDGAALEGVDHLIQRWFTVEEKIRNGSARMSDIEDFPEPLWQAWLRVIQWWWDSDIKALDPILDTDIARAVDYSVRPVERRVVPLVEHRATLVDFIDNVHREKGAAYGGSWKKRGEMLSILANIARKVDRLLVAGETSDETLFDTAMDTTVYLAKYRWWLTENAGAPSPVGLGVIDPEEYDDVRTLLEALHETFYENEAVSIPELAAILDSNLAGVTDMALKDDPQRYLIVDAMLRFAWQATSMLWETR